MNSILYIYSINLLLFLQIEVMEVLLTIVSEAS